MRDEDSKNGSAHSEEVNPAYAAARKLSLLAAEEAQRLSTGKISKNASTNSSSNPSNAQNSPGGSPEPRKNDSDNVSVASYKITVSVHEEIPEENLVSSRRSSVLSNNDQNKSRSGSITQNGNDSQGSRRNSVLDCPLI